MKRNKAEKVWKYLLKNKLATPTQVAKATGVSYGYVHKLMSTIGTPREVIEAEERAKEDARTVKMLKARAKNQSTFDTAIANAPIREPFMGGSLWGSRYMQVVIFLAIAGVIGLWLYVSWL